ERRSEFVDDLLHAQLGAGELVAAQLDQGRRPLDLLGQRVDVRGAGLDGVEDRVELAARRGVAQLVRLAFAFGHGRAAPRIVASSAVARTIPSRTSRSSTSPGGVAAASTASLPSATRRTIA